jgi:hypothetical protein
VFASVSRANILERTLPSPKDPLPKSKTVAESQRCVSVQFSDFKTAEHFTDGNAAEQECKLSERTVSARPPDNSLRQLL